MAARERLVRVPVRMTVEEREQVVQRARAHGVSASAYGRAAMLGHRPGSTPGTPAHAADVWWDSMPPKKRGNVFRWLGRGTRLLTEDPQPGQLTIEESL